MAIDMFDLVKLIRKMIMIKVDKSRVFVILILIGHIAKPTDKKDDIQMRHEKVALGIRYLLGDGE
jgi:hypothetical protein